MKTPFHFAILLKNGFCETIFNRIANLVLFKSLFQYTVVILVRLISTIVGEKAVRQTIRRAVFDYTGATPAVIGAGCFRTHTFFNIRTLHF